MIIEFEINGARVIVSGENLSVSVTEDGKARGVTAKLAVAKVVNETDDHAPSADQIRDYRKSLGMRQHQFCKLLGVTQATVSRWETGDERPRGSAAVLLHKLLSENAA
jgi:DNA-binding transcriptional regulator YiaG